MKTRRPLAAVALSAATALAIVGCGRADPAETGGADEPYRVLVTGGISAQGVLAANAQTAILAAQAGARVQNESGGIGGRRIELTIVDDGGDPTKAVTELRKAISAKKPDLFLSSGPSSVSAAVLPILNQNDILSFGVAPTPDSTDAAKFPLNFDLGIGAPESARGIVGHAKEKGYDSIGVIHGSTAYGELFGKEMTSTLEKAGLRQAGNEEYEATALDMTAQLQSLKNAGAEAVAVDAYGAPLGYILQNMQRLGWDVPLIGNISVGATNLVANEPPTGVLGTPQVENLVVQVFTSTVHDADSEAVNRMVDTMASIGTIPSTLVVAGNYDAFPLVAAGAEKAGTTTDAGKLAQAIETDEVQETAETAFFARYNFSADSHGPNPSQDEMRFIAPTKVVNGQFGSDRQP
ncbi:amino acid/amide ABC transporter substrate-binding protein (HAAT family) [Rhodococcus sp. OK519]|uniref:ABC transporter substrate-binding protein n=1 Tax=Rhodococcus sp. OK519 TaxID=2135729 RepID=UPI000D392DDB|nr:amino acid/amide ABC transporter substrate-binding protein (HAAT family) [Rhodococcus sp. OK519]